MLVSVVLVIQQPPPFPFEGRQGWVGGGGSGTPF